MIQLNAYAIRKKKNKGCILIACLRPPETGTDRSWVVEEFIKAILSVYEHQF